VAHVVASKSMGFSDDDLKSPDINRRSMLHLFRQGKFNKLPLMIGIVANESGVLMMHQFPLVLPRGVYEGFVRENLPKAGADKMLAVFGPDTRGGDAFAAAADWASLSFFVCGVREVVKAVHKYSPAYLYRFSYVTQDTAALGLPHTGEILWVTGNFHNELRLAGKIGKAVFEPAEYFISDVALHLWAAFASDGPLVIPGPTVGAPKASQFEWQAFGKEDVALDFNSPISLMHDVHRESCELLNSAFAPASPGHQYGIFRLKNGVQPWWVPVVNEGFISVMMFAIGSPIAFGLIALSLLGVAVHSCVRCVRGGTLAQAHKKLN